MSDLTPSQSGATEMQASEPQTQAPQAYSDGLAVAPDVAQAVAASNASTSASLSTTEASTGAVSSESATAPLSTSTSIAQGALAASGESLGGTASTSGSAIGASPAPNSSSPATAAPSTAADPDTGSIAARPAPTTAVASPVAGDALSLGSNASVYELNDASAPAVPAPDPVTPLAPGAEQATPNTTADVAFPAAMLARLHADLEELERKIGQGIHVFAHEVAAIRDQVAKLI